ncbi:MAG: HAMP domain-containing histidine kinase [Clostridia bacterium]|nr:HAMP domain-containing histidine kinase [Clostridia bacterium]
MTWTGQHFDKKNQAYFNFLEEIEGTLDRIAKCDFSARIDTEPYRNKHYYYNKQIIDVVEKVNIMARELSGMETMRQDFVSNVSHEIQSPLTSIRGFVSLLKDENLNYDERLHYTEIIESECLRLSKLSDNLLKLTTLDSEYAEVNPQSFPLNRQLKDVILLLEPQWTEKNIEVSYDGCDANIVADEDLLSQVWINLLNNSIKFTPDGGKISVSVSQHKNQIQVMISDTGIGMTKESVTHIFERFYMADIARSRSAGGSGLGLSIVKKIIQMHGGEIDVKSKPGEGTTFTVTLSRNAVPV